MTIFPEPTDSSFFGLYRLLEKVNHAIYALWRIPYPEQLTPSKIPAPPPAPEVLSFLPSLETTDLNEKRTKKTIVAFTSEKNINRANRIKRSKSKMAQKLGRRKSKFICQ